ncbi:MAG: ribonuclease P protein component [Armatimonadota bacterium]
MSRERPRTAKIRRKRDFKRIFSDGRRFRGSFLTLVKAEPSEPDTTRCAFVVGKDVGKAVVRNRVKRRLREAARRLLIYGRDDADFVVIARPGATARDYWDLGEELAELLCKAGIIGDDIDVRSCLQEH